MLQVNDYRIIDCGSDIRRMYEFNGRTPQGERVIVEVSECYPFSKDGWGKNGLPTLWAKAGYTDGVLPNYLCVHTYAYDADGQCWGMYNPQECETWDGKRRVLNFDWMLTVSKENTERLLAEVVRRANAGEPTPMEAITEQVKDSFKSDHKAFQWEWDAQKMRRYTRHELVRHLLLMCEVYYHKDERTMADFNNRLYFVYPDTTDKQVQQVYDRYAGIVTAIYG